MAMVVENKQHINDMHPGGWRFIYPYNSLRRRITEAWWVLAGKQSLHKAYQAGYDQHTMDESARRARGGR